jgi:hypothetical protein
LDLPHALELARGESGEARKGYTAAKAAAATLAKVDFFCMGFLSSKYTKEAGAFASVL